MHFQHRSASDKWVFEENRYATWDDTQHISGNPMQKALLEMPYNISHPVEYPSYVNGRGLNGNTDYFQSGIPPSKLFAVWIIIDDIIATEITATANQM